MRRACPSPHEDCPYFERPTPLELRGEQQHGCFSDQDHVIPRSLGRTALERLFIERPDNKQQLCRWEHDQKTKQDQLQPPELPPLEVMRQAIQESYPHLSNNQRRHLGEQAA